jgi:uncharacterized protein (DUF2236 family)
MNMQAKPPKAAKPVARGPQINFLEPAGDPGLSGPGSSAWKVFHNPLALAAGGIAAVILELAEPAVRAGVWDHSTFKVDPIQRMVNTGAAAMAVTFGSRKAAQMTFDRVTRMHERVTGTTHEGKPYQAMDPELLTWVHVTAAWGFLQAYIRYADPQMSRAEQDRYYREGAAKGYGFGAKWVPMSVDEVDAYMAEKLKTLYANDTVQAFIKIVGDATPMGKAARPLQRLLTQAGIDLLTDDMQKACGVRVTHPLGARGVRAVVGALAATARFVARRKGNGPAEQACRRMGVSTDCLYPN